MNIGIDIGWTIKGVRSENNRGKTAPNSFDVISKLVKKGHQIFLISKVNSQQKEEVERWLKEVDFFNKTNVNPKNLYFCFERRDKQIFADALNIKIMIDDRAEVLAYMSNTFLNILISPDEKEYNEFKNFLQRTKKFDNWEDIGGYLTYLLNL